MRATSLKSNLLRFASASAMAFAATPAMAQDANEDDDGLEEIVITGIRASIRSSIEKKRDNTSIVEAISAEDIGKLPDASIGESLARLPGLAAQRFDGRANKVSIRGLAPDFTATTMNGREMVSSDNNRSVEFDQFPSELITGATVYKTPDATLTTQSIGGTVDMQTVRPLSYDDRAISFGLRGELGTGGGRNAGISNKGYRGNFAYIDQNEDGTVGWALGYSRIVQPISEQHIHYWGYQGVGTRDHDGDPDTAEVPYTDINGNNVDPDTNMINGIKPYVKSNRLTRDGLLGVLEFQASDTVRSRIDLFYSKFDDKQTLRGMELPLRNDYRPVDGSLVAENGLVTSAQFENVYPMLRNDFIDREIDTYAFGWNTEWQANDTLVVTADISYSKAKRNYASSEMYLSNGRGKSGQGFDVGVEMAGENGIMLDTDVDLTENGGWQLGDNLGWGGPLCTPDLGWACSTQDLFRNTETSSDDLTAIKLAAEQSFDGSITSVEFGVRYSERNKDHTREGRWAVLQDHADGISSLVDIPDQYREEDTSLDFIGLGGLVSFNPRALWDSGIYTDPILHQFEVHNFIAEVWDVKEKVFNAYVKANFHTENITGNMGMQAVHTDQFSEGSAVITEGNPPTPTISPTADGVKYWKFLPSLNASFHIDDTNKIRFGAARIMARPNMDAMHASRQFDFNGTNRHNTDIDNSPWSAHGGNPTLKPWMSWQFDLAYENYYADGGYFSVAGFYKKLDSWVYDDKRVQDFSGYPFPPSSEEDPTFFLGYLNSPQNGEGGKLYGAEFSATVPFELISDTLKDFGFMGSASFTKSEVRARPDDEPFDMPGLSKTVINGTLYYENDSGFQARVSIRDRSPYVAESFALNLGRENKNAFGETIIDAQVSYDLDNIGIYGATVYLQGSNLTNEPYISYENDNEKMFRNYHTYGRNIMFGFSFKM